MEKKKNTPKLRFKDNMGQEFPDWDEEIYSEIGDIISGYAFKSELFCEKGYKLVTPKNFTKNGAGDFSYSNTKYTSETTDEKYLCKKNDLLLLLTDLTPKCELLGKPLTLIHDDGEVWLNQRIIKLECNSNFIDKKFLSFFFLTENYHKVIKETATGSTVKHSSANIILNLNIPVPSLSEQTKIATFLTAVDEKLTQLKKKKTLLEQYKKGVMQKLFSQELRFKDENNQDFPDWQEKTLGEISNRVITKNKENNLNVLTISAQNGLVSQLEFFNKSVSAKDVTGYYLLDRNDFAYNKSYSNGYPMGAIKRLTRYEKGVVSTLYICFRNKTCFDNSFAEQYFETGLQNNELEKVAQEGARNHGLLNIGVSDFFKIELTIPSLPEQQKIATFLSAIDEKINQCSAQIEKMEAWKKGLLQQMFC